MGDSDQLLFPDARHLYRILIIDDEALVSESVKRLLEVLGHEVEVASGGEEGLEILGGDNPIDVVILDLTMPGMSGRETLMRIRESYPDLCVILCSGYSADADQIMASKTLRANGFLGKPFRIKEFCAVLSSSTKAD